MKFSVCIPNYNYANYLGQTLSSVLDQSLEGKLEVLISDNASTDTSVDVVHAMGDERVQLQVNRTNLGFAANLDCAARMASGEVMIMLSSDDLMLEGALGTYERILGSPLLEGRRVVISSSVEVVDASGRHLGVIGPQPWLWKDAERVAELETAAGGPVYRLAGDELLGRSVRGMRNPLRFASTAYPSELYRSVGGYGGGRLVNPDKWFHWRLLGEADDAYFVDCPLFAYRWHAANQSAQQLKVGALKFLVDEYVSTFQLDDELLARIGLSRPEVITAFVRNDVVLRGLSLLAEGKRLDAKRAVLFARAAYPHEAVRSPGLWLLRLLLQARAPGQMLARASRGPAFSAWRRLGSRSLRHGQGEEDRWIQPVS